MKLSALFAGLPIMVLVLGTACLETLPEATTCPSAPVFEYCPNATGAVADAGPDSGMPVGPRPDSCGLARDACLLRTRGVCECRSDLECTRSTDTCHPPPDCPATVRSAAPNAQCLGISAEFGDADRAAPCSCGCASCAGTCDGKGPVVGANQVLRFTLPSEVPVGRLGVMVRARGSSSALTLNFRGGGNGPPQPVTDAFAVSSPEFVEDVLMAPENGPRPGASGGTPGVVELRTDPSTINVEIDCIVVFVAPS